MPSVTCKILFDKLQEVLNVTVKIEFSGYTIRTRAVKTETNRFPMKKPHSPPSRFNPTGIASHGPVAKTLSSARNVIRHREEMVRTQDRRVSVGWSGWNLGAWGVFRFLALWGLACRPAAPRRTTSRAPRSLGLVPGRIAVPVTTALHARQPAVIFPDR